MTHSDYPQRELAAHARRLFKDSRFAEMKPKGLAHRSPWFVRIWNGSAALVVPVRYAKLKTITVRESGEVKAEQIIDGWQWTELTCGL